MKKLTRFVVSYLLVASITFTFQNPPKQAEAADSSKKLGATYFNASEKYLYLREAGSSAYNFNVKKELMEEGSTYFWYVEEDKGNPKAVTIHERNGVVNAKEAGTAYIGCIITLIDGTVIQPEARVTVRNNITIVEISNIPEKMTLTAGIAHNFNRNVLSTSAGKNVATQGITRWEIKNDTAGALNATSKGIVFPIKEGSFQIRAVCFQSLLRYNQWLADKKAKAKYITAASEWATIKVNPSNGSAIAASEEQLNKALAADSFTEQK